MFQNKASSGQAESKQSAAATATGAASRQSSTADSNHAVEPVATVPCPTEEQINEEKMRLLSVDLEAKVSDILNKIEKNVDTNPRNQRSMSHLLPPPTAAGDMAPLRVPTQWHTAERVTPAAAVPDDEMSDVDEDDVEAIVRRIEEVAIKLTEPTQLPAAPVAIPMLELPSSGGGGSSNGHGCSIGALIGNGGSSSALDARIENLINNSFISTKEVARPAKKPRVSSSSRHHKSASRMSSSSPSRAAQSAKAELAESGTAHHHHHQSQHQHQQHHTTKATTTTPETAEQPHIAPTPAPAPTQPLLSSSPPPSSSLLLAGASQPGDEEQKDDIEIYDLLGV